MASPTDSSSSKTKNNTAAWLVLAGIALLAGMAVTRMFADRFESGENYPEYSTMRTDPLGARALFEAIDMLPNVEAVRNFESLHKLARDQSATLFNDKAEVTHKPADSHGQVLVMAGVSAEELQMPSQNTQHLERFVRAGGRLVLALDSNGNPSRLQRDFDRAFDELDKEDEDAKKAKERAEKDKKKAAPVDAKKPAEASPDKKVKDAEASKAKPNDKKKENVKGIISRLSSKREALSQVLQVTAVPVPFELTIKGGSKLDVKPALPLKPDDVPEWFSNIYIDDNPKQDFTLAWTRRLDERLKKNQAKSGTEKKPEATADTAKPAPEKTIVTSAPSAWKVLASKGSRPMIMQRSFGAGTVILCTDRYFLSNEALWKNPKPKFISWLIGNANRVIFEETHLGAMIGDQDGLMTLARRYRMHGLFLGGVILFALYIWRNAFSLVPATSEEDLGYWRADAVAGQSSASGLEGLLRRGIKYGELLPRCFTIWSGTRAAASAVPASRREQAMAILAEPGALKNPVSTYRRVRDVLHPAKK